MDLTTNRTNFHEWGAALPENFVFGLIRGSNTQRLDMRVGRAHSLSLIAWVETRLSSPNFHRSLDLSDSYHFMCVKNCGPSKTHEYPMTAPLWDQGQPGVLAGLLSAAICRLAS
jgi:hypothetical protein